MHTERSGNGRLLGGRDLRPAAPAIGALACFMRGIGIARGLWSLGIPQTPSEGATLAALSLIAAAFVAGVIVWLLGRRSSAEGAWRAARSAALGVVVVALGLGWWQVRVLSAGASPIALALERAGGAPVLLDIEGVVTEAGVDRPPAGALAGHMPFARPRHTAVVRVDRVGGRGELEPSGARLRRSLGGPAPNGARLTPGERIAFRGFVRPAFPPRNPGESDARLRAWSRGVVGSARLGSWSALSRSGPSPAVTDRIRAWQWRLQARARTVLGLDGAQDQLKQAGSNTGRALLGEVLLGVRDPVAEPEGERDHGSTRAAFRRVGLAHLLAISGFHLAALAAVLALSARALPGGARWGALAAVVGLLLYLLLVPARPPVLRAGAMLIAWYGARAAGRRYHPMGVLAWVAVGLLIWRPMDLFDAGFQFSALMTAALIALTERAHGRLWGYPSIRKVLRGRRAHENMPLLRAIASAWTDGARLLVSVSVLCWSIAAPIGAVRFGYFSPLAVLATVLIVPLLTPVLWIGYVVVLVGLLTPGLAGEASGALAWAGGWIARLGVLIDSAPGASVPTPAFTGVWAFAAATSVVWWWHARRGMSLRAWAPIACVAIWGAAEARWRPAPPDGAVWRVDTLAVGDGTCHLVRVEGGGVLLWDCGSLWAGVGERVIPEACRALGVARVRDVVLSHPNFDHYSGLLDVLRPLGVERVLVGDAVLERAASRPFGSTAAVLDGLERAGGDGERSGEGDTLRLGRGVLEFIGPAPALRSAEANDRSLIARLSVDDGPAWRRTGDAQRAGLASLMAAASDALRGVAAMELPHHGSHNEEAERLIRVVDPRVVSQSTGPSRTGDARWDWARAGRVWLSTAEVGAVWVALGADGDLRAGAVQADTVSAGSVR